MLCAHLSKKNGLWSCSIGCVSARQSVCIISEIPAWFRSRFEYHYIVWCWYCYCCCFCFSVKQPPSNQFSCANVSILLFFISSFVIDGTLFLLIARNSPIKVNMEKRKKGRKKKKHNTFPSLHFKQNPFAFSRLSTLQHLKFYSIWYSSTFTFLLHHFNGVEN